MRKDRLTMTLLAAALTVGAQGQVPPPTIEATPVAVESTITSVTLYRGRASVTRSAIVHLAPGLYDIRFDGLPESIQPASLQARTGARIQGPAAPKVIGVDFAQEPALASSSAQVADLDAQIEGFQRQLKEIGEQRELLKAQEEFIASIAAKTSAEASQIAGTQKLEIESLRTLMAFVAEERQKLLGARRQLDAAQRDLDKQMQLVQAKRNALGAASAVNRTAVISVASTETVEAVIEVSYLVANATWEPTYNVRATLDGSSAVVEYDAVLIQRSGEDWDGVRLLLSTAQPTLAANPPTIEPWFVDVRRFEQAAPVARSAAEFDEERAAMRKAERPAPGGDVSMQDADIEEVRRMLRDAEVAGGGPSVTFELPRAVTVKTSSQKQQRTRIALIDTRPKFVHVAVPALTEAVYIRGELTNASAYHFLPGPASIFIGQDYVGPTAMESVAPGGEFKVHFGIDPAVKATRHLVQKLTESTGLLSGGRRTTYDYRLSIDNGAGKPLLVELWDRYPVSRNEDIQVELVDVSDPLSADAYYVAEEKPQGLLKWIIDVPAGASGRSAHLVTFGVHIDRAKDIEMTPLPE